jgi:hypothetical protein
LWLVVVIGLVFFVLYVASRGQQPGHALETLGLGFLQLAVVCMAVGEFLYPRMRLLAGLFLLASIVVLFPLSMVLSAAHFFSQGTTFGLLVALLFLVVLLAGPGRILYRYLSTGDGDDERQDSHQYTNAEANWLDKTVWTLFATGTRERAVVMTVLGGGLIVFAFAFTRFPLPLIIVGVLPLALILAGISRLLYDSRRTLARLLEAVSLVLLAGFWAFLVVGLIVLSDT